MTYYLTRTFEDGRQETIPYGARGTVDAIKQAQWYQETQGIAKESQVRDRQGRVIATFLANDKGPGSSVPKYVQLNLFK